MAEKKKDEGLTIEEAFAQIDQKIEKLSGADISLEDSFKEYEAGMKLLKYVNGAIDQVEQKVQKITGDGKTEDFENA